MSIVRKMIGAACLTACTCGLAMGQTNPTPRTVPFSETFGTAGSTTAPSGFAAWNGLSGASVGTQTSAEASAPSGNATISAAAPSGTGGAYYYAVASDARLAVNQSSNTSNGVNQWVLAINTTGSSGLTLDYDLIAIAPNATYAGVVTQYRIGHSGTWTSLSSVSGNPYTTQGAILGSSTHVTIPLPAAANNQAEVQIRFANWRVVVSGSSSIFGIDNVAVSAGAIDPAGSCCNVLGACSDTTQSNCSGTFTLAGACLTTTCTATQGACCNSQGTCTVVLPASCTGLSQFQLGVACPSNCTTLVAACCNSSDGTCSVNFPANCPAGTTAQAGGTSCTPTNNCPQPLGACCSGTSCTAGIAANACTAGNWLGLNTVCDPGVCTPPQVVMSQVYGGGGATTAAATYQQDYVELFNRSGATVDIGNWTLQYASSAGTSWNKSAVIPAGTLLDSGKYFLVVFSQGTGAFNGTDISGMGDFAPVSGNLSMAAGSGKIALVRSITLLSAVSCPIGQAVIVDFVGYGSADCHEGTNAVAALSNTTAAFRAGNGCTDTDQNGSDFTTGTPAPRNQATAANVCGAPASGTCCDAAGVCTFVVQASCSTTWTLGGACLPNPCVQPSGTCCNAAGVCTFVVQASCSTTWTLGGACLPNPCLQPANGTCCRGATCSTAYANAADCAAAVDTVTASVVSKYVPGSTVCNTPVSTPGSLGNTTAPCCYANYNHNATLEVQDIFDFLNDWFAGKKAAIVGGNGTTGTLEVQNIFDFLNAWFAGGCI